MCSAHHECSETLHLGAGNLSTALDEYALQRHQLIMAEEEYTQLKMARIQRRLDNGDGAERCACIIATSAQADVPTIDDCMVVHQGPAGGGLAMVKIHHHHHTQWR